MEPISGKDPIIALLRQKLEQRAKATSSKKAAGKQGAEGGPVPPQGIRALAAIEGIDERQMRRALIEHLLTEQLGSAILNDAQFQQIVTRVTGLIEQDESGLAMLKRALAGLRSF